MKACLFGFGGTGAFVNAIFYAMPPHSINSLALCFISIVCLVVGYWMPNRVRRELGE